MLGIKNISQWYKDLQFFPIMLSSFPEFCFSLFFQIKLQESPEDMPAGQTPHTVILFAHNDLVDKVQPGDRVNVTGKNVGFVNAISFIF